MGNLYIGFKGVNNASFQLVSLFKGEKLFLTNSFPGLARDIGSVSDAYSAIFLFGIDGTLTNTVRIERCAEQQRQRLSSVLPLEQIAAELQAHGITSTISDEPTHYLCNDAYFKLLAKNERKVVLIHIPSINNTNADFFNGMINSIEKRGAL